MKYWVFDLDGTLVDSHSSYFECLGETFKTFGGKLTDEDKAEVLRISSKDREFFLGQRLGIHQASAALADLERRLMEERVRTPAFEGVMEILKTLNNQNFKMAVWTARDMASAQLTLKSSGLHAYFSAFMSGSCVNQCKPHPEGLVRLSQVFGCEPTDMIMVGDHDNDMKAAKAFGAKAVRVQWHDPKAPLVCKLADWHFKDARSMFTWVNQVIRS